MKSVRTEICEDKVTSALIRRLIYFFSVLSILYYFQLQIKSIKSKTKKQKSDMLYMLFCDSIAFSASCIINYTYLPVLAVHPCWWPTVICITANINYSMFTSYHNIHQPLVHATIFFLVFFFYQWFYFLLSPTHYTTPLLYYCVK